MLSWKLLNLDLLLTLCCCVTVAVATAVVVVAAAAGGADGSDDVAVVVGGGGGSERDGCNGRGLSLPLPLPLLLQLHVIHCGLQSQDYLQHVTLQQGTSLNKKHLHTQHRISSSFFPKSVS